MKILVTGGAGFIGSHVADEFIKGGHRVVIVDNLKGGRLKNVPNKALFVKMDIRDRVGIKSLFKRHKFDVVNNHAAQMSVPDSMKDPMNDADHNVRGLLNILENARLTKVGKIIQVSSGGTVYGSPKKFPIKETAPILPESPYGITKAVSEDYLRYYNQVHGMRYSILRYSNVYGPRQMPHGEAGVVAIFILLMKKGISPVINGRGNVIRDYVYCGDVARANRALLTKGHGRAFNIATGVPTNLIKLHKVVADTLGWKKKPVHGPDRAGDVQCNYLDCSRARRELGWKPRVDFAEGVRRTAEFFNAI